MKFSEVVTAHAAAIAGIGSVGWVVGCFTALEATFAVFLGFVLWVSYALYDSFQLEPVTIEQVGPRFAFANYALRSSFGETETGPCAYCFSLRNAGVKCSACGAPY